MNEPLVSSLGTLLRASMRNAQLSQWTGCAPGKIQSYSNGFADVVLQIVETTDDGSVEEFSMIPDVPVCFPGAGGALIKWTPQPGDVVLVMWSPRSLDSYKLAGDITAAQLPRRYDKADAIAIPVGDFDAAHVRDASPRVEFTGSEIQVGGSTSLAVNSELAKVKTALLALASAMTAAGGSPVTGTVLGTAINTALNGANMGALNPLYPAGTSVLKGS